MKVNKIGLEEILESFFSQTTTKSPVKFLKRISQNRKKNLVMGIIFDRS